jgi:hypothetical protein
MEISNAPAQQANSKARAQILRDWAVWKALNGIFDSLCSEELNSIRGRIMAPIRTVSVVRIEVARLQEAKGRDFVKWGERFFAHFESEKGGTNADLMELIYWLGDDGRQELALSIFNFLRSGVWKDFCQDRRVAKQHARKELTLARSDLSRARGAYSKLLDSTPEIGMCRRLGDDQRLHLSDILEGEADFLAARARIARAAGRSTCRVRHQGLSQLERSSSGPNVALLSTASAKLTRAARSYRRLLTLHPTVAIGKAFDSFIPTQLPAVLESEEDDLRGIMGRVDAFNKKRLGTNADLGILVRLQYLVEIFGLRWASYLPENATRILRESDIADLLEAGTVASGMPERSASIDAESIGRSLERFQQRKSNSRTCLWLRRSAEEICDRFRLLAPATKTALKC